MIYVSSACLKKSSIVNIIQELAKNGIRNIELSGGTDYYDNLMNDLINLKKKYDLTYACHAYFPPPKEPFVVNLASCNNEIYQKSIAHYENCIGLLEKIECNVLSLHAGFLVEVDKKQIGRKLSKNIIYDREKAYDRFCSAYTYIAKLCEDKKIKLYLENNVLSEENYREFGNCNYMMMTDFDSIVYMKSKLDFELLLDLGHLFVSCQTLRLNYEQECEKLKSFIKWMHLSENNGILDQHKPLNLESTILKQFGKIYQKEIPITLETVGQTQDIKRSICYLTKVIEGIRVWK